MQGTDTVRSKRRVFQSSTRAGGDQSRGAGYAPAVEKRSGSDAPFAPFSWGDRMIQRLQFRRFGLAAAVAAFCISSVAAQAPTGPAPGGPPQTTPPPGQTPPAQAQKPEQGGLSISVEVPIVTMNVVATTQHGDIISGLKRENFRLTEDGIPQTIT